MAKAGTKSPAQKTATVAAEKLSTIEKLRRARVQKERLRVKQLQLVLADKGKDFLDRYCLKEEVIRDTIAVRSRLAALPTKVAPMLSAMSDPIEIQQYLLTELRRELNDLARSLEDQH